jgi:ABC-type uncharacterized transport system substrate-binding protein
VRQKPDVLVAVTTNAALAVRRATTTIPIVFMGVTDPVTAGLVESLSRPGGNTTGITNIAAILTGKRLELLKETHGTEEKDGARYVDRILRGARPADLPVEQPMKFELVINLVTAQKLDLAIPQSVLFQADKIIR